MDVVVVCNGFEVQIEFFSWCFMGFKVWCCVLVGCIGCGVCGVEQFNDIGKLVQLLLFIQLFDLVNFDQVLVYFNDF